MIGDTGDKVPADDTAMDEVRARIRAARLVPAMRDGTGPLDLPSSCLALKAGEIRISARGVYLGLGVGSL